MFASLFQSLFALFLVFFSFLPIALASESPSPSPWPAHSGKSPWTNNPGPANSTLYTTTLITVTQCPSSVQNCPAESKTVAVITTSCPITAPTTTSAATSKPWTTSVVTMTSTGYFTKVVAPSPTYSPWYPASGSNSTTPSPTGTGAPPAKSSTAPFTGAGIALDAGAGLRVLGMGALAAVWFL